MSGQIGKTVKFKSGKNQTEYTAKIVGEDGTWWVTKDAEGKERKTRKGSATVID